MSAGAFTRAFYDTNNGIRLAIRVQPETLAATLGGTVNASKTAPADQGYPRATVHKSRKSPGIHARTVTLQFTATPPTGYKVGSTYILPVMDLAVWTNLSEGAVCTYLGVAAEVVSTNPEKIR